MKKGRLTIASQVHFNLPRITCFRWFRDRRRSCSPPGGCSSGRCRPLRCSRRRRRCLWERSRASVGNYGADPQARKISIRASRAATGAAGKILVIVEVRIRPKASWRLTSSQGVQIAELPSFIQYKSATLISRLGLACCLHAECSTLIRTVGHASLERSRIQQDAILISREAAGQGGIREIGSPTRSADTGSTGISSSSYSRLTTITSDKWDERTASNAISTKT